MRNTRKIFALALLLALAIYMPVYSEAATGIVTPCADNYFQSYSISLSKSGTTIHISFRTTAVETAETLGAPSYDVQRLVNGSWTTVADDLTGSTGSDTVSYSFSKNYSSVSGYAYRVKAKFYCKKDDGTSETVSCTSGQIST